MAYTEVFAWGSDSSGQLGLSDSQRHHPLPRFCSFNLLITAVSCGDSHTALLDASGKVHTIGSNENGQLGVGVTNVDAIGLPSCVDIEGESVVGVSCGAQHTLAVTARGNCYAWGEGVHGALGTGITESKWSPTMVLIPAHMKARSSSAGGRHSAFICDSETRTGVVLACGKGAEGQLGVGRREVEPKPIAVAVGEEARQVACGRSHTLLLTLSGKVLRTYDGGLATVSGLGQVAKVAAGRQSAALTQDGKLYVWESNAGNPSLVFIPKAIVDLSIGDGFAAVVDSSAQVWTWGENSCGALGLGDFSPRQSPTPIQALHSRRVTFLSCGSRFTLALGRDIRKPPPSPSSLNISEIVMASTRTTPRIASTISFDQQLSSLRNRSATPRAVTSGRGEDSRRGNGWELQANEAIRLLAEEKSRRKMAEAELADRHSDLLLIEERLKTKEIALVAAQRDIDELKVSISQCGELQAKRRKIDLEMAQKESEIASLQALLEKSRIDLAEKSQEIRELSLEMESQTNELKKRAIQEEKSRQELETSLKTLAKQLKDSETAFNAAKLDVKRLKIDLEAKQNLSNETEIRELKEEINDLRQLLHEKDSLQSIISSQTDKIAYFEGQIEVISKENIDLRQRCSDLELSLYEFKSSSTDSSGRSGDLLDQLSRLNRELNLTKDSLRKAEEHNKHLLETIERKSLTMAREYRERSLNVLKTPSPLRSRPKSPIPALSLLSLLSSGDQPQDENEYARDDVSTQADKGVNVLGESSSEGGAEGAR